MLLFRWGFYGQACCGVVIAAYWFLSATVADGKAALGLLPILLVSRKRRDAIRGADALLRAHLRNMTSKYSGLISQLALPPRDRITRTHAHGTRRGSNRG
jgi:hypothetical protein